MIGKLCGKVAFRQTGGGENERKRHGARTVAGRGTRRQAEGRANRGHLRVGGDPGSRGPGHARQGSGRLVRGVGRQAHGHRYPDDQGEARGGVRHSPRRGRALARRRAGKVDPRGTGVYRDGRTAAHGREPGARRGEGGERGWPAGHHDLSPQEGGQRGRLNGGGLTARAGDARFLRKPMHRPPCFLFITLTNNLFPSILICMPRKGGNHGKQESAAKTISLWGDGRRSRRMASLRSARHIPASRRSARRGAIAGSPSLPALRLSQRSGRRRLPPDSLQLTPLPASPPCDYKSPGFFIKNLPLWIFCGFL